MATTERKRRTRGHVIADLGVNHVEKFVLQCGWTVQRFNPDYGLDLLLTTFNLRGEIENGDVRVQIKATDSFKVHSTTNTIPVRVEWRDMIYWLNERLPVILAIYDAKADRAWWIHLNDNLREEGRRLKIGGWLTLKIPLANVLTAEAIGHFRDLRDSALARDWSGNHENE